MGAAPCPRGMTLQSLAFNRNVWTEREAKTWASAHGYPMGVDVKPNYWRIRVENPAKFSSFRWGRPWLEGLHPIYGCPKKKMASRGRKSTVKIRPAKRVRKVAGIICVCRG